jgi:hypothetical protein
MERAPRFKCPVTICSVGEDRVKVLIHQKLKTNAQECDIENILVALDVCAELQLGSLYEMMCVGGREDFYCF